MLYWTTLTSLLSSPPYLYTSAIIGLFGLIGIAAIIQTPFLGRILVDQYNPLLSTILGSLIGLIGQIIGTYTGLHTVAGPIIQAYLLDLGPQTAHVANRAATYTLDVKARNRINSVYMLFVFFGQTMGTGAGNKALAEGGWLESGGLSVGFLGLSLVFALMRGPHEKGWIGWSGGASFVLERKKKRNNDDDNVGGGGGGDVEKGNAEADATGHADAWSDAEKGVQLIDKPGEVPTSLQKELIGQ